MNRASRRAQRPAMPPPSGPVGGVRFRQRPDPEDPRFVLIDLRIPNGGMPEASYADHAAVDRLRRFAEGLLEGMRLAQASDAPLCAKEEEVLTHVVEEARALEDTPVVHVLRSWAISLTWRAGTWRLVASLHPRGRGVAGPGDVAAITHLLLWLRVPVGTTPVTAADTMAWSWADAAHDAAKN